MSFPSKVLFLAGGFGSRLGELTRDTPKPLLPVQGTPILEHLIRFFASYGVTDVAISVFYHKDKVKDYFGDGSRFGVRIQYVEETQPLGTAGCLRLLGSWLSEPFFMMNADILLDGDLRVLVEQHKQTGARATIALTRVDDPSSYGVAALEGARITRFIEKPRREDAPSTCINAGLYLLEPSVIEIVPEGFVMIEKEVFPHLANEGALYGVLFDGQWHDIGTIERYATAEQEWTGFTQKTLFEKKKKEYEKIY